MGDLIQEGQVVSAPHKGKSAPPESENLHLLSGAGAVFKVVFCRVVYSDD